MEINEPTVTVNVDRVNPTKIIKELLKGEDGEKIKHQITQETQGFKKPQIIKYLLQNFSKHPVWNKYR